MTVSRLVCSINGRKPTTIGQHRVPLPETIDDEYLLEHGIGSQPSSIPSVHEAFNITACIFEIIDDAPPNAATTEALRFPELTQALQLNEKVDKIQDTLPQHLRYGVAPTTGFPRSETFQIQSEMILIRHATSLGHRRQHRSFADILLNRILHVRLVILRPCILAAARQRFLSPPTASSLNRTEILLGMEVSTICIRAAVEVIDMLSANITSPSRVPSCVALFVTLSAATVLVAASLVPGLGVSLDEKLHEERLARAIVILDTYCLAEFALNAKNQLLGFIETARNATTRSNIGELLPRSFSYATHEATH